MSGERSPSRTSKECGVTYVTDYGEYIADAHRQKRFRTRQGLLEALSKNSSNFSGHEVSRFITQRNGYRKTLLVTDIENARN